MKVRSFIKRGAEWCPVEIEINFIPGIPQFHFLGLPDTALKESQLRIKSALKNQGFEWPKAKQVIVNMRPHHIRKSSQGLDLAIACAFLWATGQVPKASFLDEKPWIYGELGLGGEVLVPRDIFRAEVELNDECLLTGADMGSLPFATYRIQSLKELSNLQFVPRQEASSQSPEVLPEQYFCRESAELLKIIALGEHNALLVGPAGSGKTTFAKSLKYLLQEPEAIKAAEIRRWALAMGWPIEKRPFVAPHHSTPNISMIGGGIPPLPGEITRAHNGVLFLDELLEFSSQVKESLREPIQDHKITISRRGERKVFPADFLLLATSNLCPCGKLIPGKMESCRFSLLKCRSYIEKLSGPLADRFSIMAYTDSWQKDKTVSLIEIKKHILRAQNFIIKSRNQIEPNQKTQLENIISSQNEIVKRGQLCEVDGSLRRGQALLRVSRTLADLEENPWIEPQHVLKARAISIRSFQKLDSIFS